MCVVVTPVVTAAGMIGQQDAAARSDHRADRAAHKRAANAANGPVLPLSGVGATGEAEGDNGDDDDFFHFCLSWLRCGPAVGKSAAACPPLNAS